MVGLHCWTVCGFVWLAGWLAGERARKRRFLDGGCAALWLHDWKGTFSVGLGVMFIVVGSQMWDTVSG